VYDNDACSIFLFDGIATSGGRSLDRLSMRFGNVACFPCLSLIMTTSKEGSMSLILLLNSTLTMKVNLWAIHCDISGGIEVGSYCFFKVSALFPISSTPFFLEKHKAKAIGVVCSYETNFVLPIILLA